PSRNSRRKTRAKTLGPEANGPVRASMKKTRPPALVLRSGRAGRLARRPNGRVATRHRLRRVHRPARRLRGRSAAGQAGEGSRVAHRELSPVRGVRQHLQGNGRSGPAPPSGEPAARAQGAVDRLPAATRRPPLRRPLGVISLLRPLRPRGTRETL